VKFSILLEESESSIVEYGEALERIGKKAISEALLNAASASGVASIFEDIDVNSGVQDVDIEEPAEDEDSDEGSNDIDEDSEEDEEEDDQDDTDEPEDEDEDKEEEDEEEDEDTEEPEPTNPPDTICNDDSTSWYKKGDTSKNCIWVGEFIVRCGVKGEDKVLAYEACPCACVDYDDSDADEDSNEGTDEDNDEDSDAGDCVDSTTWYKKGDTSKSCSWVLEYAEKRCNVRGFDRVLASYACPNACDAPCLDDTNWYKKGDTQKNCAWVSTYPQKRCFVIGEDDTKGYESCPNACDGIDTD